MARVSHVAERDWRHQLRRWCRRVGKCPGCLGEKDDTRRKNLETTPSLSWHGNSCQCVFQRSSAHSSCPIHFTPRSLLWLESSSIREQKASQIWVPATHRRCRGPCQRGRMEKLLAVLGAVQRDGKRQRAHTARGESWA